MDLPDRYWIIGGDGAEYGPVSRATLQDWIGQGRVAPSTRVRPGEASGWTEAGRIAGLEWPSQVPPPPPGREPAAGEAPAVGPDPGTLAAAVRSQGNWFYWIAGLSAVNIALILTGSGIGFAVSTTVTDLIGHLAGQLDSGGRIVALALDAVVIGGLCLLGWLAGRGSATAFLVGLVLYGLDGVLAGVFRQWISAAFHAYVVWNLFKGWQLARLMGRVKRVA